MADRRRNVPPDQLPGPVKRAAKQRAAISAHAMQAETEGVALPGEVGGGGRKVALKVKDARGIEQVVGEYRMAEKIGLMPLLRFAHVSSKGIDSADMEGLAALYDMIRDVIDGDEWDRFQRDATESKASDEELLGVVSEVVQVLAQGRTGSPSGSSAGRRRTSPSSKASSPRTGTALEGELVSVDSLLGR